MDAQACLKKLQYVGVLSSAVPAGEQKKWVDAIFKEQPYLTNVYPGEAREIGIEAPPGLCYAFLKKRRSAVWITGNRED